MNDAKPPLDPFVASLRNSAIGAALVGFVLIFVVIRLHENVAWNARPGEYPEMAWVAMIFPALAFLLALVNWRAYRRHVRNGGR